MAKRQDEFAALARDFDNMAARIETLVHVQERLLWDIPRTALTFNAVKSGSRHGAKKSRD